MELGSLRFEREDHVLEGAFGDGQDKNETIPHRAGKPISIPKFLARSDTPI
jgi:hypothetical protein